MSRKTMSLYHDYSKLNKKNSFLTISLLNLYTKSPKILVQKGPDSGNPLEAVKSLTTTLCTDSGELRAFQAV